MAVRPESVEDWFQVMPNLLSSEGWGMALARPKASLSHCTCPWGGHLIKFNLRSITIQNAPEKTSNILVRPEVRFAFQNLCPMNGNKISDCDFIAPGEAVLRSATSWRLMRLCSVLFGDIAGQFIGYFFNDGKTPAALHHKLRRDFPLEGDSSCAIWQDDAAQGAVLVVRPDQEGTFTIMAVFRVPEDRFATWATFQFRILLESARKTAQWFLNRPGICELRKEDEKFYMALSIQSFKRGMPLVPSGEPIITIDAGERLGLKHWARFQPGQSGSGRKFRLSEYLSVFLNAIGEEIHPFDVLDGRELVPYQCVVRRSDWQAVRKHFFEVFPLAKTAYRRANGGSSAPGVHEDVDPKFLSDGEVSSFGGLHERVEEVKQEPRLIVRNTFLDIEDDEELQRQADRHARNSRRPKTTMVFPMSIPVYVE